MDELDFADKNNLDSELLSERLYAGLGFKDDIDNVETDDEG